MSKSFVIGAAGALALAAGAASANTPKTYTNSQGGRIPDFTTAGGPGLLRQEIVIPPDNDGPIKAVNFSISLPPTAGGATGGHSWVGDLIITLTHKDTGRSVTIVNRPGSVGGSVGDSSDFAGTYNFSDMFTADLPAAAAAAGAAVPVPPGNYAPFSPLNSFAADGFKFGTWSLQITDNAAGDTGGILSWSITVFNVPTPGAAALFGLAGLAGIRRRR